MKLVSIEVGWCMCIFLMLVYSWFKEEILFVKSIIDFVNDDEIIVFVRSLEFYLIIAF